MSPNVFPIEPIAKDLKLRWLTPQYKEDQHGVYRTALLSALSKTDGAAPRNIAVTGPYGSGKSSILRRIAEDLPDQTVSISLSSLGGNEPSTLGDGEKAEASSPKVTKFIQKEIVKQLLYSQTPEKMRGSRYHRATAFNPLDAIVWALVGALSGGFLAFFAGGDQRFEQLLPNGWDELRPIVWVTGIVLLGVILYMAQSWTHGRFHLEKLSAGPASMTLTDKSAYYFDEFLDDIVFYFRRTRKNIVILEDLDRFDNAHIFDTLRELNTILNTAGGPKTPPIRFVYAIKDSMFEQIVTEEEPARSVEPGTSRTKFFELVIPIVPFISHRTALDLIEPQMERSLPAVGSAVVRLVAKHVTDMRLIKNIGNEYDIFSQMVFRLDGIKNLRADSLFAMIVYKNHHLGDFEKITSGTSNLDKVYRLMRETVERNLGHIDDEIAKRYREQNQLELASERSKDLATRLMEFFDFDNSHINSIEVDGTVFSPEEWTTAQFWRSVGAAETLLLTSTTQGRRFRRARTDLESLLGTKISISGWIAGETDRLTSEIELLTDRKSTLRRATLAELLADTDLVTDPKTGNDLNDSMAEKIETPLFANAVIAVLGSPLATELVRFGFIDRNFGLYAARYYGRNVSANAMTYIIKVVQPRSHDYIYAFDNPTDIDQLEIAAGHDLLNEQAIYNVEIFDHLLRVRPHSLDRALQRLSKPSDVEVEFLDQYLKYGAAPDLLISRLAGTWTDIFQFLNSFDGISEADTNRLLSAALSGARDQVGFYTIDRAAAQRIEGSVAELTAFTTTAVRSSATQLGSVASKLGLKIPDLQPVSPPLRGELIARNAFDINWNNLLALASGGSASLDRLRDSVPQPTYEYLIIHLRTYLQALDVDHPTVGAAEAFDSVVSDLAGADLGTVTDFAMRAVPDAVTRDLLQVNVAVWPALARAGRVAPTLNNIHQYIIESGTQGVDSELGRFLETQAKIVNVGEIEDANMARGVTRDIIESAFLTDGTKIRLIEDLVADLPLATAEISPQPGELFGALIEAELLIDDENAFVALRAEPWEARRAVVNASIQFPTYVANIALTDEELREIATDLTVSAEAREAVLRQLGHYSDRLTTEIMVGFAQFAFANRVAVAGSDIELMLLHHVPPRPIVKLMVDHLDDLPAAELLTVLQKLGNEYARVPGRQRQATLPDDDAHKALLQRLQSVGLVGKCMPDKQPGYVRVFIKYGA
ncbi:hypothetical protein [Cryobacterium sp. PH31-L1]|uniref:YobI family P-loop NTPase n=1 Tax=Cryobacterium sp. PH31-L1 TaxID=3046199 RepID=UPI0024B9E4F2|nr:hypothetical protein [Cryobacterium sp. PH31-L1]MDJ0378503.1 hypothetical protein [Cryobacterium sp. PH31-L1]